MLIVITWVVLVKLHQVDSMLSLDLVGKDVELFVRVDARSNLVGFKVYIEIVV